MLLSKISEKYLYIFYLFGLTVYNPHDKDFLKSNQLIKISISTICLILFTLTNGILSFDFFGKKMASLNDFLYVIYVTLMVSTGLMAFKRSTFLRRERQYHLKYFDLEELLLNRLKLEIQFEKFINAYKKKLIWMVFFFSSLVVIKLIHRTNLENIFRQIGVLNLSLITLGVNFHILFHVDIFNYTFKAINLRASKLIETNQSDEFVIDSKKLKFMCLKITEYFKILKAVHFKMWIVRRIFNKDFGAVFILLIIQNTNTAIQTVYWIILELYEDNLAENRRIISMYFDEQPRIQLWGNSFVFSANDGIFSLT